MKLLFKLGHQPKLSQAEIEAVLHMEKISFETLETKNSFFSVETKQDIDAAKIIQQLGGTIAIYTLVSPAPKTIEAVVDYLDTLEGKIQFSIEGQDKKIGLSIKKELKSRGRSVRYIEPKNTATIIHNNLVEKKSNLVIFNKELYFTSGVQNIVAFSNRDYGRPNWDEKSGMLPPKLARIMINLSGVKSHGALLDPFCGSGTLLLEGLSLGVKTIVGTDLSEKAIQDSKANVKWFLDSAQNPEDFNVTVGVRDVRKLIKQFAHKEQKFDAIVTEPYMGIALKGDEPPNFLKKQTIELADLYRDAFRSFEKVLKPDGTIIFIIPKFKTENTWIVINCLDAITNVGFKQIPFSEEDETLMYHRPGQYVGREIFKFKRA